MSVLFSIFFVLVHHLLSWYVTYSCCYVALMLYGELKRFRGLLIGIVVLTAANFLPFPREVRLL